MKILIVNTRHYLGGGDSTYSFNLCDMLRLNGHEVYFMAMQDKHNLPDPNSDLFVNHIDFRELNHHKNISSGFRVFTRSIYSIEARTKFSRLLDRVKPDLVHLQNIHAHITPSVIFEAKKQSIPVVWTLHDYKLICPNSHLLIDATNQICEACQGGYFFRAVLNRCKKNSLLASIMACLEAYTHHILGVRGKVDLFLCPSRFLQKKLLDNGFDRNKVRHLPLFLSHKSFNYTGQHEDYFLFLGKLEPLKGIDYLIRAARHVPNIKIIAAGRIDENIRDKVLSSFPPNLKYVGMKSGEELDQLRKKAIALVLPSICYENQPFSILEMFALGKPAIVSDLGGMRELVGDNERGWLVKPRDDIELANAIDAAYRNPFETKAKGENAYSYITKNHSEEAHYQCLSRIYQELSKF
jgi:glycosyltransferase involved in cell wall biosynthesis